MEKEKEKLKNGNITKETLKRGFYGKKTAAVLAVCAGLLFCISAVPFLIRTVAVREYVLQFPGESVEDPVFEIRRVPRAASDREAVEELVKQVILGSENVGPSFLFPYETKVNQTVITADGTVLIDLSPDAAGSVFPIEEAVGLLKKNIRRNFPRYEKITVTVNGNDPVVVNKSLEGKDSER